MPQICGQKRADDLIPLCRSARLNRIRTQRGHEVDLLAFASRLCALGDEEQLEMCRARSTLIPASSCMSAR